MTDIGISLLTSVVGIALITGVVVEAIKRATNPTPDAQDRWLPLANLIIGALLGIVGAVLVPDDVTRQSIATGIITGFFGGASAGGLYDAIRGFQKPTT